MLLRKVWPARLPLDMLDLLLQPRHFFCRCQPRPSSRGGVGHTWPPHLDSTNHSICGQTKNECQREYILYWTEINSLQQCQVHSDKPPAGIIPKTTYILQQHEVADCTLSPLISWLTHTFFACSRCQPCPIPVVTSCSWSVCMWSDHLLVSSSWFLYSVYHAGA